MNKGKFKYLIVASHRRSGTHWLIDTLFNNFKDIKHGYFNLDRTIPGHEKYIDIPEFLNNIREPQKILILKTHTPGNLELYKDLPEIREILENEILPNSKIIYIYRDCRDALLSLYFYLSGSKDFDNRSFNSFLVDIHELDDVGVNLNRIEYYKYHIESWIVKTGVFSVKYEDLHYSKLNILLKLEKSIGIDLRPDPVEVKLNKYNIFQRAIRRVVPQLFMSTAILPGKGVVGEWKKHCDNSSEDIFNRYCGKQLIELGYENDGKE